MCIRDRCDQNRSSQESPSGRRFSVSPQVCREPTPPPPKRECNQTFVAVNPPKTLHKIQCSDNSVFANFLCQICKLPEQFPRRKPRLVFPSLLPKFPWSTPSQIPHPAPHCLALAAKVPS